MKKKFGKVSWILSATLFGVVAFILFKFWLTDDSVPVYASNIAAAFFGTIITVAITAVLLKQQLEIETTKEFNLKITETKIQLYCELMNALESSLTNENVSRSDALKMAILSRKIVFVASMGVLKALNDLTGKYSQAVNDGRLNSTEQIELLSRLGAVSIEIRKDIISGTTAEEERELVGFMEAGVSSISGRIQDRSDFTLNSTERADFEELISLLDKSGIKWRKGSVGYSILNSEQVPIAHIYPDVATKKSVFLANNLSEDKLNKLSSHSAELGVSTVSSQGRIQIPSTISVVDIYAIIKELQ